MRNKCLIGLSVLGLILWSFCFFVGLNYVNAGTLAISAVVALFLFLVMGAMVYLMVRHSNPQEGSHYRDTKKWEFTALTVYVLASLASVIFVFHFITFDTMYKSEVRQNVDSQLRELAKLFQSWGGNLYQINGDNDDDVVKPQLNDISYGYWVQTQEEALHSELKAQGKSVGTIKAELATFEDQLVPSEFKNMQSEVKEMCDYGDGSVVVSWNWFFAPVRVQRLNHMKGIWEGELTELSLAVSRTENEPFTFEPKHKENLTEHLTQLSFSDISFYGILAVIVMQVLILLYYLINRPRHGRDPIRYKGDWATTYNPNDVAQYPPTEQNQPGDNPGTPFAQP